MSNKKSLLKLYFIGACLIVFGFFIASKLVAIQIIESDTLLQEISDNTIKYIEVDPIRGNIYSSKGLLLATSLPKYEIRFDLITVDSLLFYNNVGSLAKYLSNLYQEKTDDEWLKSLLFARERKERYYLIDHKTTYEELQLIKKFPIFSMGKYKGGLIIQTQSDREMPFGKMAERTIGQSGTNIGFEGAYNHQLSGQVGYQLMQKITKKVWKQIENSQSTLPINGHDVFVTIDALIQDFTHHALLDAVEYYEADYGSAIVMEVKTGKVRAISNLSKTRYNTYAENFNHAIHSRTEVGSTFKLMSLIAALEDGCISINDQVQTGNGTYVFYDGEEMKDTQEHGLITVKRAFEVSSNIGIAKLIDNCYRKQPSKYIDRLYMMSLNEKLNLDILGERPPKIRKTTDKAWSKLTLPWMATGYEVEMTPLQILTFYNAVANNGEMVKPLFLEQVQQQENIINKSVKIVLNPSICSKQSIKNAHELLLGVIENGTTKSQKTAKYKFAGKTGTIRLNYWKDTKEKQYQASFVGYYPAEDPRYSCIVVINNPNPSIGYYGSIVAAPVFRRIMDNIHSVTPLKKKLNIDSKILYIQNENRLGNKLPITNKVPNVIGMPAMDALYLLENYGFEVRILGKGRVRKQSIKPGGQIKNKKKIIIELA